MEERVEALERRLQFYDKLLYAIGAVAVVFGIGGGWGLTALSNANAALKTNEQKLAVAQDEITELLSSVADLDTTIAGALANAEDQVAERALEMIADLPTILAKKTVEDVLRDGVDYIRTTDLEIFSADDVLVGSFYAVASEDRGHLWLSDKQSTQTISLGFADGTRSEIVSSSDERLHFRLAGFPNTGSVLRLRGGEADDSRLNLGVSSFGKPYVEAVFNENPAFFVGVRQEESTASAEFMYSDGSLGTWLGTDDRHGGYFAVRTRDGHQRNFTSE